MRKIKKILAWLTVLTVNVSMMPMPTVAAATATDTDTSNASSETTTDAAKEATKAQEAAAKAVDSATKAAATTAAKKATTETKKSTDSKAKSAASTQSLQDTIEDGIIKDRDQTKIDVSSYDASKSEVKKATNKVLKDNNLSKLTDVTYDTNSEGKVESVNVETDATYLQAVDELEAINDAASDEDKASEVTMEQVEASYAELQSYYESQPDYFGIAVPYFTSKDAKEGPITALLSVADIPRAAIGVEGGVTIAQVKELVDGFNQALPMIVKYYGDALLAAKDQALAQIKDDMTPAEKLLVLNDWLGNYSNFDMADIMKEQKKDSDSSASTEDVDAKVQAAADDPFASLNKSTAFGTLVKKKSVCMSYTAAYNYLVQCAFPDVYKNSDGTWKTKDEVNGKLELKTDEEGNAILDSDGNKQYVTKVLVKNDDGTPKLDDKGNEIYEEGGTPDYMIDFVRIQWNSKVEMLGEESTFNNPHFFSAAKVDGKWYYVDSCYNDIYVECMQRNRVETDGNMTHSYFLVSDTTLRKQFDGNFDYIDTLYENVATDTTYENAWVKNAQGPVSYDDTYYYYIKNTSSYSQSGGYKKGEEQLVRVPRKSGLTSNDGEEVLLNLSTGETKSDTEGGELVAKEFAVDNDVNSKKYAGITHSAGYYNNTLYFNVNNKIFKYDLATDKITEVKEYNTVSAQQDTDNEFTGMSFTVTSDKDKTVHTVKNHPIAALAIKDDGKMYVSIATNYCYASGYKYEETNYNSSYMNYKMGNQTINRGGDNDNQEFMWSANFVDTLDMSKVSATDESAHNFKEVTVDPTCDTNGFTEERCTDDDCGVVKADTKKDTEEKATGHHYIKVNDLYYTKDDDGNRKSGTYYLCTECLDAEESLPEGETAGHTYGNATAEWNEDNTSAKITVTCTVCDGKELDALLDDQNKDTQEVTKTVDATDIKIEKPDDFDCEKGGEVTYVATATIDGKEYKVSKKVTVEAGNHTYLEDPKYTWSDDNKTCTATFTCSICGKETTKDCEVSEEVVAPTCTEKGKTVHTAKVTVNGKDYTTTKDTDETQATGHKYGEPTFSWDGTSKCTATFTCENDKSHVETVDATVTSEVTKAVTCTEDGEIKYTASVEFEGKTYTDSKTETVKATGHKYGEPTYSELQGEDGSKFILATFKCENAGCTDTQILKATENDPQDNAKMTVDTKDATCTEVGTKTYTAKFTFNGKDYEKTEVVTIPAKGHDYDENGVCKVCGHKKTASKITLKAKTATYTGKAISVEKAAVEGSAGKVTYKYYSDSKCTKEVTSHVNPGVYYVTATVAGDDSYTGATSEAVKLTINPQATKVTSVANASSYVTVSWNKVSKASGYYVYRSTDGKKFTKAGTVTSYKTVKFSDKKATKNGQKYVYKIITYYNSNETVKSAYSNVQTGYRLSTMKVSSLTNKKGKKLCVKWAKNSKATGYKIEYVTGKTTKTSTVSSAKSTTKTLSSLKKGKTYNVRIRAYKKVSGKTYYSAWSAKKKIKITK